jgi:aryl-alcohol dehydrogenase-like predicted oxidoreductase
MNYRPLGNSQIQISEIGFGAWGIGGNQDGARAYGPTDDAESKLALSRAIDRGITFFDTSPLYGYGHSEKLIGETLSTKRSEIVLSSKVGYVNFKGDQNFSPSHIRSSLEGSLRRLRTDYIDVFQLHDPPIDQLRGDGEILRTLDALQEEGKVRAIGISVRAPNEGLVARDVYPFQCIQLNFNLVDQRAQEDGVLDQCLEHGIGVISRTPLCFGFLTGKYSAADEYDSTDHRSLWSKEQVDRWAQAYRLFATELNDANVQSNAQIALRYCLSFKGITTAIPGMLCEAHVDENSQSSAMGRFGADTLAHFREIYKQNTFFVKD